VGSGEQGSRKQGAGSREQGAGSREQEAFKEVFLPFVAGGAPPVGRSQETRAVGSGHYPWVGALFSPPLRSGGVSSIHNGWCAVRGVLLRNSLPQM